MQKYIDALDRILGVDHAYYSGDKDVDTIIELIFKLRDAVDIMKRQQRVLEEQNQLLKEQATKIKELKIRLSKIHGLDENHPYLYDKFIADIVKTGIEEFYLELIRYPAIYISKRTIRDLYRQKVGVTNAKM